MATSTYLSAYTTRKCIKKHLKLEKAPQTALTLQKSLIKFMIVNYIGTIILTIINNNTNKNY